VSAGRTGHAEAVEVVYDPARISYEQLLDVFWKNIDPITPNRQFCDVGTQYRSAIFYHGDEQRRLAEESKRAIESSSRFDKPIVTEIRPAGPFYTAEEYHQDERVARIEDPAQMAARPGHLGPDPPKPSGTSRPCSAETRRTSRARS
jgi:methionine-S-sulfoxide reductase